MEAQAVVIGGIAKYLRDTLPCSTHDWVDKNIEGFAAWLRKKQRKK
jgi:molybdopterin biosynthesis enzyme MoaB